MEIKNEISSIIDRLDYKWYNELKRMFKSDGGYDDNKKRIYRVVKSFFTSLDDEGVYREDDLIINCGIKEYCWEYDFENERIEEDGTPIEGLRVARQIESVVSIYIVGFEKNDEKLEFIKKIVGAVKIYLNGLKVIGANPEYTLVLDYFLNKLRSRLASIYKQVINEATRNKKIDAFNSYNFSVNDTPDTIIEPDEQKIREILKPLGGKWLGTKIMRQNEFEDLINNVTDFIRAKGNLSGLTLRQFNVSRVPETFVRYTFYLLSKEKLNGKIKNDIWVEFLKKTFTLFDGEQAETTYKHFATEPKNYNADLINTINY